MAPMPLPGRTALPLLVLVTGLLGSGLTAFGLLSTGRARDEARFTNGVQAATDRIRDRFDTYASMLEGGSALFASSVLVSRGEFRTFVGRLNVQGRYPGVQGIGFSRQTHGQDELDSVVAQARTEGLPDFRVWPTPVEGSAREHGFVLYLEPPDVRNQRAMGFDMFNEPVRREAMTRARDEGRPALSGRVVLVQEEPGQLNEPGFLLYVPVYRGGGAPTTVAERQAALVGFVFSPFRAGDLFAGVFGSETDPRVGFEVYDGTELDEGSLLYGGGGGSAGEHDPLFESVDRLEVAGRSWTLRFHSLPAVEEQSRRTLALGLFSGGVLISLVLFGLTLSQSHARHTAERLTASASRSEARQRFLARASELLASSLDHEEVLRRLAELCVPEVADWCGVYLVEGEALRVMAVVHSNPDKRKLGLAYLRNYPSRLDAPSGAGRVARTGEAELATEIPEAALEAAIPDRQQLAAVRALGLRSACSVALESRGKILGVMTLVMGEDSGRRFDADDLAFARELGRRAAVSVDNALLYQAARDAIRLRDEFLSVASHELKTPLTPLMLKLEALTRLLPSLPDNGRKLVPHVEVMRRQVKRLNAQIADLLDVTRISSGRLTLTLETLSLGEVVRDVVGQLEVQAQRAGCTLVLSDEGVPAGEWDRGRLAQVVENLLSNAIKYGADKAISVRVFSEGGRAALQVKDRGIGIAPEVMPRIFERFERGVSERHFGGLGLGLYISRQIVDALGGEITVESELGRGTTMTVRLPLLPPEQLPPESRQPH